MFPVSVDSEQNKMEKNHSYLSSFWSFYSESCYLFVQILIALIIFVVNYGVLGIFRSLSDSLLVFNCAQSCTNYSLIGWPQGHTNKPFEGCAAH